MSNREAACSIAPALRMLFYERNRWANVVFSESSTGTAGKTLQVLPDCNLREEFARFVQKNGECPRSVLVEGVGLFALGRTKGEADAVLGRAGGPSDFFRLPQGRLAGKIAIVTGGAQGIGKGIAEAMAAEGAYVVVADLNIEGARSCAAKLCEAYGPGSAAAVGVNVGKEASVAEMVRFCVLVYGGLDILVSNAGVLIAGGLEEMTQESFELVTSVNYMGYFLCVKHAVVPMKLQREYCPGRTADIIEINSKSGLSGSNKNFAYAGSKFGGIGLTQSFALELAEYGVKVNAICPGNLLDGPLWSDPEFGLFRQYLDAGKVPRAKTVSDVRRFYEEKVPMKRGCTALDVARAVLYAVEQQYETGQAIPVTGGQVMMN